MIDIHLIFAKEDRGRASALRSLFEAAGWTVSALDPEIDQDSRSVDEAIRDARCAVVLWSAHSVKSDLVNLQAWRAHGKLIPVLIDAVQLDLTDLGVEVPRTFPLRPRDLIGWDGSPNDPRV